MSVYCADVDNTDDHLMSFSGLDPQLQGHLRDEFHALTVTFIETQIDTEHKIQQKIDEMHKDYTERIAVIAKDIGLQNMQIQSAIADLRRVLESHTYTDNATKTPTETLRLKVPDDDKWFTISIKNKYTRNVLDFFKNKHDGCFEWHIPDDKIPAYELCMTCGRPYSVEVDPLFGKKQIVTFVEDREIVMQPCRLFTDIKLYRDKTVIMKVKMCIVPPNVS